MFVLMVDPPSNNGRHMFVLMIDPVILEDTCLYSWLTHPVIFRRHMFVLMVDPLIFRTFTGRTDQSAPVVRYPSKESMRRCYK